MATPKIHFRALTADSDTALVSINTNTRAYGADGKPIEGVKGDPKIEICVMDTLDRFIVTVKALDPALMSITEEQITASLKSRQYINVELSNAFATPYAAQSGRGVAYSVKADSAKIAATFPTTMPAPPPGGIGKAAAKS